MFSVQISPDRMAALLEREEGADDAPISAEQAHAFLLELGVAEPPAVEDLTALFARQPPAHGQVLLRGQEPVHPERGRIEWAQDFFQEGFVTDDETGCVDFRRLAAIRSVCDGQLLARLVPPGQGRPGKDVFGNPVPPDPPKRVRIQMGQNVRHDPDTDTYYAAANGRLRWSCGTLAVDPVYTIHGSVGLSTGHIHHPGALVVEKDIESGSEVVADGDVEVHGTIEAADVRSSGNLCVRGGIIGAPGKKVQAGGSVHAKFIRDASVEAGADIVVEREAIQSVLRARGAVRAPRARLIGGEILAEGPIEACYVGCEALVPTVLAAGHNGNESSESEYQRWQRRLADSEAVLARIHAAVEPLRGLEEGLPANRREALLMLLSKAAEAENELGSLRDMIAEYETRAFARRKARILIKGALFPEVVLRLCDARLRVDTCWKGPVHAVRMGEDVVVCPPHLVTA